MKWSFVIIVISTLFVSGVNANGFDVTSCGDMTPAAIKEPAQTRQSPYVITVIPTQYEEGIPITVTIESIDISSFTDYLLMSLCEKCPQPLVGTFTNIPKEAGLLDCHSTKAAVTGSVTINKLTLTWVPPSNFSGVVIMKASIIQAGIVWWGNIQSVPLMNKADQHNLVPRTRTDPPPPDVGIASAVVANIGFCAMSLLFTSVALHCT